MLLLLACSDPARLPPLEALGADVTDVLFAARPTDEAAALTGLYQTPAGRLDPQGPAFGEPGVFGSGGMVAVLDDAGPVRVVTRSRGVRLLLWAEVDGLVNVVPEPVWLDGRGHPVAAGEAGVRFPAGHPVSDPDGEPHLSLYDPPVSMQLPIAPALIDDVWTPDDLVEARALTARLARTPEPFALLGGTVFRDDQGNELFQFDASPCVLAWGEVLARDDRRGALVLVDLTSHRASLARAVFARGWVEEPDALGDSACFSSKYSSFGCGISFLDDAPVGDLRLPAGALLFDAPDGAIVGVTEAPVILTRGADAGAMPGWEPVLAPSPWGRDVVWVRVDGEEVGEPLDWGLEEDIVVRELDSAPPAEE